ncbi:hypothetical protein J3R83DRAFT_598 [Lanmaoa asiatica]|nr:hypothetical protein J3R83DRAFT_598 [Lanmaoa asiatica]
MSPTLLCFRRPSFRILAPAPRRCFLPSLHFTRTPLLNATHRDFGRFRGSSSSWRRPPRLDWLDSLDSKLIFYAVIAVNAGVYLTWALAMQTYVRHTHTHPMLDLPITQRTTGDGTLLRFMLDNFRVDMRNVTSGRIWTLLTSCFSHMDTTHALFNGLTFYFMAPSVMQLLGNRHFLGLYFLGGISASLASLGWNHFYRHENISSLGASGAIMATIALYSCAFPRNTFLIFFVIPCPAWVFLPGVLVYDGWRSFSDQVCLLVTDYVVDRALTLDERIAHKD